MTDLTNLVSASACAITRKVTGETVAAVSVALFSDIRVTAILSPSEAERLADDLVSALESIQRDERSEVADEDQSESPEPSADEREYQFIRDRMPDDWQANRFMNELRAGQPDERS